ncbi:UDP-N-acetylglucosamine--undecaprenyl-phosphate N-acetylglucosaminephosphotransferase [Photobacterium sp. OFAV2-7]|uniref:UDP-N-acetylglucosamine--undecaprenyl-phosphate N-acetylglucosaminephosphotransferase n=1 Tax=Photobacterium sp. OFAV2-7 TaxID=2917748 RepID=UPI001EF4AED9|nr:UDP-N-acetylglucosamine--undecaprenyl-phosphate N-acetylglucosaminephosphotransferase [Photobacterium sp. OFAV2-7]MCG7585564.1 UDP-N-acetylglucosamine--undecaprenyl-phosphate N-acetylglucosaminephosphotransferase [Photobacterium sp. OFAV2-7]
MPTAFIFVFFASFCSLFLFRKVAKRIGLVDKPNARKHHQGVIPLVGGVSIFTTLSFAFTLFSDVTPDTILFLVCAMILVITGVVDDRYDISFKLRLLIQAGVSFAMMLIGDKSLHNLGYLMGSEAIELSVAASYLITVLGVIGAINAFNMVDGIDGLLGGLASVTFGALGFMFLVDGNMDLAMTCGLIVTAILPYIMLNLGFPLGRRFKVFMGDAGSIFIGFTVIWLLIEATQGENNTYIRPVTALWVIAIPLMDMATIMVRRIRKGQSPFKPDREHLHHICQRIGLSSGMSLFVICTMAIVMAGVGIWSDMEKISESVMFASFLGVFAVYFFVISHIWRIITFIHKLFGTNRPIDFSLETSSQAPQQTNSEK